MPANQPTAEMSKDIWEWMGNCWHEWSRHSALRSPSAAPNVYCVKCPAWSGHNPDLTIDENLHLVHKAITRAIEIFGNDKVRNAFERNWAQLPEEEARRYSFSQYTYCLTIPAKEGAKVVYGLIKESEG